jgi:hypothetical protein
VYEVPCKAKRRIITVTIDRRQIGHEELTDLLFNGQGFKGRLDPGVCGS